MPEAIPLTAPAARVEPHTFTAHGDARPDPWHWLARRDDPEVRAHLEAENAFTDAALAHLAALRDEIAGEIRSRVRETDTSAPVPHGPYEYFTQTRAGAEHRILCRRTRGAADVDAEVLLDANEAAQGHSYYALGSIAVSPDHRLLAYTFDTTGDERYTLRLRDLDTHEDLSDDVRDVYYGLAWSADATSIWFVRPDEAVRPFQVWRHEVGGDSSLVFSEEDERFYVDVSATRSGAYAVIASDAKTTSERWLCSTADPAAPPRLVARRRTGIEYEIDHQRGSDGGRLWILTNDTGADFRVATTPVSHIEASHWREVIGHEAGRRLDDIDAFDDFVVVSERHRAQRRLRVLRGDESSSVGPGDPLHTVVVGSNREPATPVLRYEHTSLTTPSTTVDLDVVSGEERVVKRTPVEGDIDLGRFVAERLWVPAEDGTQIPLSVVRDGATPRDGTGALVLYGYGAYETSIDPAFSHPRLSLLDRGVAYAIAHVRGGGELGRPWYEGGRLVSKSNTFSDFIRCAEHLVDTGYTSPDRLAARGRSAGGLLMGAVANLVPELFRVIVAEVPFVDVITTMSDPTLPLTITEWEEWGNPIDDAAAYAAMRAYSPYDNVTDQAYPAILATAGINDSRVQYWEPAKWVQRLRTHNTGTTPILLRTDMGAGHAGPSGRYAAWRDEAFVLAFILDQLEAR